MKKQVISIVTPSFNTGQYLEQTIKSVITQKGDFEIEYIVMDGGSTDKTIDILKTYDKKLKNNPKIKFIWKSEKDKGQSDAINKGMKLATGNIMAYLNADDVYEAGAFKAIIENFKQNKGTGLIYGKCPIINEQNIEIRKGIRKIRTQLGKKYSYKKLLIVNFIPQPATFWKREVYDEFGEFNVKHHLCMDYEYWVRIGTKYEGKFLNKNLANFRWYSQSKSGSGYKQQFKQELDVAKKYGKKYKFSVFIHKIVHIGIISIYDVMRFFRI